MGLSDVVSSVLTRYKADTTQHRREIKKLRGEQKKQAKEQLENLEKQNEGIDKNIEKWGKVAGAIGVATGAILTAKDAFREFQRDARIQSAAFGADIGKLRQATQGLVDDQRLLELASAGLNTEFRLSQKELEEVSRFMLVLRKQGNDTEEVFQEVKKAIAETNAEGLKKFGVQVEASAGTLEGFQAIMAEVSKQNKEFAGDLSLAGDEAEKLAVRVGNAWRQLKVSLGSSINDIVLFIDMIDRALKDRPLLVRFLMGGGSALGGKFDIGKTFFGSIPSHLLDIKGRNLNFSDLGAGIRRSAGSVADREAQAIAAAELAKLNGAKHGFDKGDFKLKFGQGDPAQLRIGGALSAAAQALDSAARIIRAGEGELNRNFGQNPFTFNPGNIPEVDTGVGRFFGGFTGGTGTGKDRGSFRT